MKPVESHQASVLVFVCEYMRIVQANTHIEHRPYNLVQLQRECHLNYPMH
jgi:hypothetical protein